MTQFSDSKTAEMISNTTPNQSKIDFARKVITGLQNELQADIQNGAGPFLAVIYDDNGRLISKCTNSVVIDRCSHSHAEINAIKKAEEVFGTYDLSPYNLSIYVTSEPCMMCLGAILWSGIKSVYYGVCTADVEKITGYDEGFKPNWFEEFSKRGIEVYGNIEPESGKKVLQKYVNDGKIIYNPSRK
jgi:tRNA(Arg) A34 adenosine deaminase TadA